MITTIQLNESVKKGLERLKGSGRETYEDVIVNLMKSAETQKRKGVQLLREGYKEMAEESLVVASDWEPASKDWK
jgi:hypothetical protein